MDPLRWRLGHAPTRFGGDALQSCPRRTECAGRQLPVGGAGPWLRGPRRFEGGARGLRHRAPARGGGGQGALVFGVPEAATLPVPTTVGGARRGWGGGRPLHGGRRDQRHVDEEAWPAAADPRRALGGAAGAPRLLVTEDGPPHPRAGLPRPLRGRGASAPGSTPGGVSGPVGDRDPA